MRAAVFHAPNQCLQIEEFIKGAPKANEVLGRVGAASGTRLPAFHSRGRPGG